MENTTYQVRFNLLQQKIVDLNRNEFHKLCDIVINLSRLFSEIKDTELSEFFLPQFESIVSLLESKTQKTLENIITDLTKNYVPSY